MILVVFRIWGANAYLTKGHVSGGAVTVGVDDGGGVQVGGRLVHFGNGDGLGGQGAVAVGANMMALEVDDEPFACDAGEVDDGQDLIEADLVRQGRRGRCDRTCPSSCLFCWRTSLAWGWMFRGCRDRP